MLTSINLTNCNIGDLIFVKLHPYIQILVVQRVNMKLSPKFYEPFKMTDRVGQIA